MVKKRLFCYWNIGNQRINGMVVGVIITARLYVIQSGAKNPRNIEALFLIVILPLGFRFSLIINDTPKVPSRGQSTTLPLRRGHGGCSKYINGEHNVIARLTLGDLGYLLSNNP
jgi:hypothetical protein